MMKNDDIVWTCEPTLEGLDIESDLTKPRRVKLRFNKVWYGHSFNSQTGEIDTDTNATAFVEENTIFATKEEANQYYLEWLKFMIQGWQDHLQAFQDQIKNETRIKAAIENEEWQFVRSNDYSCTFTNGKKTKIAWLKDNEILTEILQ